MDGVPKLLYSFKMWRSLHFADVSDFFTVIHITKQRFIFSVRHEIGCCLYLSIPEKEKQESSKHNLLFWKEPTACVWFHRYWFHFEFSLETCMENERKAEGKKTHNSVYDVNLSCHRWSPRGSLWWQSDEIAGKVPISLVIWRQGCGFVSLFTWWHKNSNVCVYVFLGVVYKWDSSFFMQRGDISPSANFAAVARSPGSLISALGTFVKGLI